MTVETLNFWLIKFVQDVCDKDGNLYILVVQYINLYMLVEATPERKWPGRSEHVER
jgi:hypothetical protein